MQTWPQKFTLRRVLHDYISLSKFYRKELWSKKWGVMATLTTFSQDLMLSTRSLILKAIFHQSSFNWVSIDFLGSVPELFSWIPGSVDTLTDAKNNTFQFFSPCVSGRDAFVPSCVMEFFKLRGLFRSP